VENLGIPRSVPRGVQIFSLERYIQQVFTKYTPHFYLYPLLGDSLARRFVALSTQMQGVSVGKYGDPKKFLVVPPYSEKPTYPKTVPSEGLYFVNTCCRREIL